ncbi:hypothetical protein ITI46_10640 [Streptomyces oryzae]|uniref:Uncharacterized protein n=1 Tax=Streptomyces oryzae TaxID=1434886 RepID=A0ABS3X9U1_9ACTN|nr:hypothetical protein [Streptomyces oryzae]
MTSIESELLKAPTPARRTESERRRRQALADAGGFVHVRDSDRVRPQQPC